jgi:ribosomal protein L7/L12
MDILATVALVVLLVGLILLGLAGSSNARREQQRAAARLTVIDRKLDAIVAHLGISMPDREPPGVLRLVLAGEKIAAIKPYREATGASLLDAKNAVEVITAQHLR